MALEVQQDPNARHYVADVCQSQNNNNKTSILRQQISYKKSSAI